MPSSAGVIAGAAIDAFEVEPATSDNPMFALDNILVSPHSAGVTEESMFRMGASCARNVVDCFDGKLDPANVVNREVLGLRPPRHGAFPAARAGNAHGETTRPLADSRPRTGRGDPVRS